MLHVNGTRVEIPGTLEVGGGATGEDYSKIDGHLNLGGNRDNAHFRFGSVTSSSNGLSPIALLRSSDANNPKLIINYGSQYPAGTEIDSNTNITGITTLGNQLHVKGDDICLGPDAQPGKSRALVCSTVGVNKKLIINYAGDFNNGVLIESNTKILGNLEVTGSLSGSAFDSLGGGSSFNNITESGSNVGIGTASPSADLHISNSSNAKLIINSDTGNNNESANPYLILAQDGTNMIGGMHLDGANNLNIVTQGSPHSSPSGDNDYDINFKTSTTTEESYSTTNLPWQNTTTRMVIKNNGYVGIGTTSPSSKLHVNGLLKVANNAEALRLIGTNHAFIAFYPQGENAGRKAYIGMGGAGTNTLTISAGGGIYMDTKVGIGREASYKLDINGDGRFSGKLTCDYGLHVTNGSISTNPSNGIHKLRFVSSNSASFAHTNMGGDSNGARYISSGHFPFRVDGAGYFGGGIWYPHALKESDRRIKRCIEEVKFGETLEIIRKSPLRKYTFIDPRLIHREVRHGFRTYGFIAQELEKSYPLSVRTTENYVPNIFSFYSCNEEFLLEEDKRPIRCEYIKEGDKLLIKVPSLYKKLVDSENIIDICKITVREELLKDEEKELFLEIFKKDDDYTYFEVEKEYYWFFIHGFLVSDFKSIDTDDVMFLHHKAIQDIDMVQQTEQSKVENLETQNTELLSKVSNLETENTQLKDKVADLEKQIKAIKEHLGI